MVRKALLGQLSRLRLVVITGHANDFALSQTEGWDASPARCAQTSSTSGWLIVWAASR
jgi:hypothetical protein